MNEQLPVTQARMLVFDYIIDDLQVVSDEVKKSLTLDDIVVVWFCKTLQNWKTVVVCTRIINVMFEVTYNGNNLVTYVDAYRKTGQKVIPDDLTQG